MESSTEGKIFTSGDKVLLVNNECIATENCPRKGSKYECIGEVINRHEYNPNYVKVRWSNMEISLFRDVDLEAIKQEINCNSIW